MLRAPCFVPSLNEGERALRRVARIEAMLQLKPNALQETRGGSLELTGMRQRDVAGRK